MAALGIEGIMKILAILAITLGIAGCNDTQTESDSAWVYINDGAVQCEFDGLNKTQTAQNLIDYNVEVIESNCGYISGIEVAAQCGLGDSNINLHLINEEQVADAQNIGYELVSTLENDNDVGYEIIDCE